MALITSQRQRRRQSNAKAIFVRAIALLLLLGESAAQNRNDPGSGKAGELRKLTGMNVLSLRDYQRIRPEQTSASSAIPEELRSVLGVFQGANTTNAEDSVETLWEQEQQSVWEDALLAETIYDNSGAGNRHARVLNQDGTNLVDPYSFPFMFCSSGTIVSGRNRRMDIESRLRSAPMEENPAAHRNLKAVYSDDSMSCFVTTAKASEAYTLAGIVNNDDEAITVSPLTPLMKIPDWTYTVEAVRNQIGEQTRGNERRMGAQGNSEREGQDQDPSVPQIQIEITVELSSLHSSIDLSSFAGGLLQYAKARVNAVTDTSPSVTTNVFSHANGGGSRRLRGGDHTESNNDGPETTASSSFSCLDFTPFVDYVFPESKSFSMLLTTETASAPISQERSVKCTLAYMTALSTHQGVYSVSVDRNPQTWNDMAQWILQGGDLSVLSQKPMPKPHCPYFDAGLTAANQIVGLSDTGIDEESCYFHDKSGAVERWKYFPGQDLDDVPTDLTKRKIVQYYMHPNAEAGDGYNGHGTHVAGTLAGRRSTEGDADRDERGDGDGIALDAKISFLDIGRPDGSMRIWKNEHLFLPAVSAGAKVHSMSWGYASSGYNTLTHNIDRFLYKNDDMLVVVAAGNGGSAGASSLAMPATAKNIISVGASHSDGPDIGSQEAGYEYIASYSARGPAGLRTKPDVVAPGHRLLSADGRLGNTGACDKKGISREDYLYHNDGSFGLRYASGTSMAAPVVAGMALQVRQYFIDGFYPFGKKGTGQSFHPSGSLVKAVIMNGAQYLLGVASSSSIEAVKPYDNVQNFGRVSLHHSLPLQGANGLQMSVHDRVLIEDGDSHGYEVVVESPSKACPFSATLVWADEPGETLINDLDLTVIRNGKSYFPNGGNGPDRANNAERIMLNSLRDGERLTVRVKAHNLQVETIKYSLVTTYCGGEDNPSPPSPSPFPTPSNVPTGPPNMGSPGSVPVVPPTPAQDEWTEVFSDSFETPDNWGHFNDGMADNNDANRHSAGIYSHSGEASLKIQDNSGVASSIYSDGFDVSSFTTLKVHFWYYPFSMDNSDERFLLEYSTNGGNSWVVVRSWAEGEDFENGAWNEAEQEFPANNGSSGQIRFRCDASNNQDKIFIDDVSCSGK